LRWREYHVEELPNREPDRSVVIGILKQHLPESVFIQS
jgi:hypothetical protein